MKHPPKHAPKHAPRLSILVLPMLLAACAGTDVPRLPGAAARTVSQDERFDPAAPHSRRYAHSAADLCEGARRALLSQGYVLSRNDRAVLVGRKFFQPEKDRHVELQMQITCVADSADDSAGSLFVTAWEDHYVVKKSATASSLGVSALGSISLPLGGSEDSLVKVGVETVRDRGFYERFHGLVSGLLPGR